MNSQTDPIEAVKTMLARAWEQIDAQIEEELEKV